MIIPSIEISTLATPQQPDAHLSNTPAAETRARDRGVGNSEPARDRVCLRERSPATETG